MLICPLQVSLDERHLPKGIVQPKMQFYCKCVCSWAILDVDEFVCSWSHLEKLGVTSVAQQ